MPGRPRRVAGRQHQPGVGRAVPQGAVREDLLDLPGVEPVGHLSRQSLVHPAQELAFRVPERRIPPSTAHVAAARVDVHGGGEPRPQQAAWILVRHGDDMDLVRRDVPGPHVQDGQRVVNPPEPRPAAPVSRPLRGDHRVEPRFPSGGAAALDRLLPLGRQEGGKAAHGDNDMHFRAEQRPYGALGLLRAGRRQHLVGDDRPVGGTQRLARQDVPLAGPWISRVGRGPRGFTQVPARPRMVAVAVTRQLEPLGSQPGPVGPQRILQKGRARLRLADVQVNARAPGIGNPIVPARRHPARV